MTDSLYTRILELVASIPPGRVATYGEIAAAAGNLRASRAVVWALRSAPSGSLPWHRVVNRKGRISSHENPDLQRVLLESEGVEFDAGGTIDLNRYSWR